MPDAPTPLPTLLRYCLLQIPGITFLSILLWWALDQHWITAQAALGILLGWLAKDVALYPMARRVLQSPQPAIGTDALIGRETQTATPLNPRGIVRFGSERWIAQHRDNGVIAQGTRVRVTEAYGLVLVVEAVDEADSDDTRPARLAGTPHPDGRKRQSLIRTLSFGLAS